VDPTGELYISYGNGNPNRAISAFAPGSTTPDRTIVGHGGVGYLAIGPSGL
jgi:hypothetical protein